MFDADMFEYYFETANFHLKYARGKPSVEGREFHSYDEILFFISGDSRLISKEVQMKLNPGNMVFIPKEHFHQFCVREPDNYTRCILGFRETPQLGMLIRETMKEVFVLPSPPETINFLLSNLLHAAESDLGESEKMLVIESTLALLLVELKQVLPQKQKHHSSFSLLIQQALAYIDTNYSQEITVKRIAEALNVCTSTLSHRFKCELNMPVYRYLSEKRMSMARQYIENGETLSSAALLSGFRDYSNFYRMYKCYYRDTPSKDLQRKNKLQVGVY